ncbi:hypothetical protein BR93DRAFT_962992 [Coniochaeta sp. PMI_546]|nr:hypothetical protein BR93DRAFT_962992 [Coniochaeta sp. PMI_546]
MVFQRFCVNSAYRMSPCDVSLYRPTFHLMQDTFILSKRQLILSSVSQILGSVIGAKHVQTSKFVSWKLDVESGRDIPIPDLLVSFEILEDKTCVFNTERLVCPRVFINNTPRQATGGSMFDEMVEMDNKPDYREPDEKVEMENKRDYRGPDEKVEMENKPDYRRPDEEVEMDNKPDYRGQALSEHYIDSSMTHMGCACGPKCPHMRQ